jgi:hypothetical protein
MRRSLASLSDHEMLQALFLDLKGRGSHKRNNTIGI